MKNLSKYQKELVKKHNAEMKIISDTAKANKLSKALLFYAAQFGIMGIPWIVRN